jgi:hypothetical protein
MQLRGSWGTVPSLQTIQFRRSAENAKRVSFTDKAASPESPRVSAIATALIAYCFAFRKNLGRILASFIHGFSVTFTRPEEETSPQAIQSQFSGWSVPTIGIRLGDVLLLPFAILTAVSIVACFFLRSPE